MKKTILAIALVIAVGQTTRAQVSYIERSWDAENKQVVETVKTCSSYTEIAGQNAGSWLGLENNSWYVVKGSNVTYQTLNIMGSNVHLILCDGARITLTGGLKLEGSASLTVYGQTEDSGVLDAYNNDYSNTAGLGSAGNTACGNLIVHGGNIHAQGKDNAAGIGGGKGASSGSLTMYGGLINTTGGDSGAGIGGGKEGGIGGTVNIYGGKVIAIGGVYGAGIGGGDLGDQGGTVNIYGGTIKASGKFNENWGANGGGGAGIGGGDEGIGGNVNIYGGDVKAYARGYAAGIGGGQNRGIGGKVQISGGTVEACGYESSIHFPDDSYSGAGIGGGSGGSQGGDVIITGGNVTARGGVKAAGIGGGAYYNGGGDGGKVIITGGTVFAVCGKNCKPSESEGGCAIGSGYGSGNPGTIEFGMMMVNAGADEWHLPKVEIWTDRESSCHSGGAARIEPCDHIGVTGSIYSINDGNTHARGICTYCGTRNNDEAHTFGSDGTCPCGLLSLKDNDSNASLIETWNNQTATVTLDGRTFYKDGSWNTLCLPFTIENVSGTVLGDAVIKTLISSSFDAKTCSLTLNFSQSEIKEINAGWPYIVRWDVVSGKEKELKNPIFRNVTLRNTETIPMTSKYIDFIATYNPVTFGEEGDNTKLYLGSNNMLYYPDGEMTINAFRGYFQLKGDLMASDPGSEGIKAFVLNFDEEATGIRNVDNATSTDASVIYDLHGRRVGNPTNGLYIQNGRKVVFVK